MPGAGVFSTVGPLLRHALFLQKRNRATPATDRLDYSTVVPCIVHGE